MQKKRKNIQRIASTVLYLHPAGPAAYLKPHHYCDSMVADWVWKEHTVKEDSQILVGKRGHFCPLQKKREKFCQWHFFQSSTGADYK
jgi:hypothetical protein